MADPRWQVEALIAGPMLPDAAMVAFQCEIKLRRADGEWTPEVEGTIQLVPPPESRSAPFVIKAPQVRFRAFHQITTTVTAPDEDQATAAASVRFARMRATLAFATLGSEALPFVHILGVHRLHEDHQPGDLLLAPQSHRIQFNAGGFMVQNLDQGGFNRIWGIHQLALADKSVLQLLDDWTAAETTHQLSFRSDDLRNSLLGYAKVLEDIAAALAPDLRTDTPEAIAEVGAAARDALGRAVGRAEKNRRKAAADVRKAVQDAARAINELELGTVAARLRTASKALALRDDVAREIQEVWKLRSQLASHPSQGGLSDEVVLKARRAADHVVRAYLTFRLREKGLSMRPASPRGGE